MQNVAIGKKLSAMDEATAARKPSLKCYKCNSVYHYRLRRNWFFKNLLFFLPFKIYFCGHCVKKRYLLLTDKQEMKYKPV